MCALCGTGAEPPHWSDHPLADRGRLSATGARLARAEALTRLLAPTRTRVAVQAGQYVARTATGRAATARHLGVLWPALATADWDIVRAATPTESELAGLIAHDVDWADLGLRLSAFAYDRRDRYARVEVTTSITGGPVVRITASATGTGRLDVVHQPATPTLTHVPAA